MAAPTPGLYLPGLYLPGLYLVATPIGHAADITLRALDILRGATAIACEDTRVTSRLLARHGVSRPLLSYHEHNAAAMRPKLLARIAAGQVIALVSDAGMPLISDPGYKLVRACVEAGLPVTAAPGANAALTALVLSGLPSDRFLFAGFLPPKAGARRETLAELAPLRATLIFYESARRLPEMLAELGAVLGDRPAAVARELTKLFEEVRRGTLTGLAGHYAAAGPPKGEVVVVVGPPPVVEPGTAADGIAALDDALRTALAGHGVRDAAALVAGALGLPRRQVYARALELTAKGEKP
ncbi:16S rRNA 2'-O-ribose C1402 methyltransferase [uncultured Gammaproteobacteria bacterium]